jgi:hypothetical protein
MAFLRKLLGAFIFIVITVPVAWIAVLAEISSPVPYVVVAIVSFLVARALWKDRPSQPLPVDQSEVIGIQAGTTPDPAPVQFNYEFMPPGYAELGLDERLAAYDPSDCLGRAAEIGKCTQQAMDVENHDLVWRLVHMQKVLEMQHAAKSGFSRENVLALDGKLHRTLAGVLHKEGKHKDALVNILYWASSYDRISGSIKKKVQAFIDRANVPLVGEKEILAYLNAGLNQREITEIQQQVDHWYGVY